MSDIIEQAQETEQQLRSIALANRAGAEPPLPPCGKCYFCQASVPPGVRFCDKDCRDDHTALKSAERRRGVRPA